jgi:RecA/RadA recombinase
LQGGRAAPRVHTEPLVATGVQALDDLLGGGFPRGILAALEGDLGRRSIAARMLAQATLRGMAAVLDDGELYPPGLVHAGVRLDRLLIVPVATPLAGARAVDLLLRSRVCGTLVMPALALRAPVWARLAGLAHRSGTLVAVVAGGTAMPHLTFAATVRLRCTLERLLLCGSRGPWCNFAGYDVRVELRKHKYLVPGAHASVRALEIAGEVTLRERAVEPQHAASAMERAVV